MHKIVFMLLCQNDVVKLSKNHIVAESELYCSPHRLQRLSPRILHCSSLSISFSSDEVRRLEIGYSVWM